MLTAVYKFTRNPGVVGSFSKNRPSTNALNALVNWTNKASSRSYAMQIDGDEFIVAELMWNVDELTAGNDLETLCRAFGVDHTIHEELARPVIH